MLGLTGGCWGWLAGTQLYGLKQECMPQLVSFSERFFPRMTQLAYDVDVRVQMSSLRLLGKMLDSGLLGEIEADAALVELIDQKVVG